MIIRVAISVYIRIMRKGLVDDRVENSGSAGARRVAIDRLGADHTGRHRVARLVRMLHAHVCSLARRQRETRGSSGIANSLVFGVAHDSRAHDGARHQAKS